jgi:hypothetical protein
MHKTINSNTIQKRALNLGIESISMKSYVERFLLNYPELLDLLAIDGSFNNLQATSFRVYPEEHVSSVNIVAGLKIKKYHKGTIRCKRDNPNDCYVLVHTSNTEQRKCIIVQGTFHYNFFFNLNEKYLLSMQNCFLLRLCKSQSCNRWRRCCCRTCRNNW